MKYYLSILLFLALYSCGPQPQEIELDALQTAYEEAQARIALLETQVQEEGPLVHLVFFRLQASADQRKVMTAIQQLEAIPEVLNLEVGPFEDLGDARAMNQYQLIMTMDFADAAAYDRYQIHAVHLALKEELKPLLAGPPVTYDFFKR